MKQLILLIFLSCTFYHIANAQEKSTEINRSQLTLMVVPYTSKGEDIRAKIENDFSYRVAINTISKAFEDRNYTTDNFIEALKSNAMNQIANTGATQTDLWKQIQENAPDDIFVYAEVFIYKSAGGNKVEMLLSAVDKYSGQQLASSDLLSSNQRYTEDYAILTKEALTKDGAIENFLNALDRKFKDISTNGRSVEVRLELNTDSQLKFDDEIGTDYDLLSDKITDWVKQNAFKNDYHVKSKGSKLIWYDKIKIPIKNEDGTNYMPEDFGKKFYKFLRGLSTQVKTGKLEIDQPHYIGSKIQFNLK